MFFKYCQKFLVVIFLGFACFAYGESTTEIQNAPIAPFGKVLFNIYGNLGSSDAQRRAEVIEDNIKEIKKDTFYNPAKFKTTQDDGIYNIVYDGNILLGITDKQVQALGKDKADLASQYQAIIIQSVEQARRSSLWLIILKQALFAGLILLVTFLSIKYTFVLHRYINALIWKQKNKANEALRNELDLGKHARIFLSFLNILKIGIVVTIVFTCLVSFLAIFPFTHKIAAKIGSLVFIPIKTVAFAIWNYIPSLLMIIVIITLFRVLSRVLSFISDRVESGSIKLHGFRPEWAGTTYSLVWVILLVFTIIFMFPFLPNSNSPVFKGISVFLGVLISLGSSSLLNNLMSGLVITYMSPFKVGDGIKMGENMGVVIEKNALVTRIKTIKNEIITIPNSVIMTANTVNYTASARNYGLILHTVVTVGYEVQWRTVHKLLLDAAAKTPDLLKKPEPFVLQSMLDDYYVRYEINAYTEKAEMMGNTYSILNQNIQDVFNEAGVEIASPHIFAVRDGGTIFAPQEYRRGGGKVSHFEVSLKTGSGNEE